MKGQSRAESIYWVSGLAAILLAALFLVCSAHADSDLESWSSLQEAISGAESGDIIALTVDVTAGESDTALVIPDGMKITLDLNGFTVDRNQKTYSGADGTVIQVLSGAVLTIMDSGKPSTGTITGGYSSDGHWRATIPAWTYRHWGSPPDRHRPAVSTPG